MGTIHFCVHAHTLISALGLMGGLGVGTIHFCACACPHIWVRVSVRVRDGYHTFWCTPAPICPLLHLSIKYVLTYLHRINIWRDG